MLQEFVLPDYSYYPLSIQEVEKTGHLLFSPQALAHDVGNSRILQFPNKILVLALDLENQHKTGHIYENNFKFGDFYLSKKEPDYKSQMIHQMSFDTIKFGVPCSPMDFENYKEAFLPYQRFERYTINQSVDFSNEKFKLLTPGEMDSLPSYYNGVAFGYSDSGHVVFEMSIPKQLYGHNSLMYWQLDSFFHRFRNYLLHCTGLDIEPWEKWLLKRVDVCYNYHLDSYDDVKNTISYLQDLRMRNRACHRKSGKNIAYWAFQTRTIKFYSKYEEMQLPEHRKNFDPNIYDVVLKNSMNILRFEEEWRSKYLLSKLDLKRVNEITVGKFLDYVIKHYNRYDHIKNILGEASMTDRKFSLRDTLDSIKQNFKKSSIYSDFVLSIVDKGLDKTKASMSKSTYYDRVNALKEIGIDVSVINERFHYKVESEGKNIKSDFTNSPLSNLIDDEAMFIQSKINPNPEPISLRDFLANKEVRFNTIDGLNACLPPEYEIKLFAI
jgi:II/X family phage/plasmid replication protein